MVRDVERLGVVGRRGGVAAAFLFGIAALAGWSLLFGLITWVITGSLPHFLPIGSSWQTRSIIGLSLVAFVVGLFVEDD